MFERIKKRLSIFQSKNDDSGKMIAAVSDCQTRRRRLPSRSLIGRMMPRRRQTGLFRPAYNSLENRQLLALAAPPLVTTDVVEFASTVEDAIVRIDQERLIIRTFGAENEILVELDEGYIQVNAQSSDALALQIDPSQYDRILLLSNGEDAVNVFGRKLQAQLRPESLWVFSESVGGLADGPGEITIHGTDLESVNVSDSLRGDVGPFILRSSNRIRFYGGDGVDHLQLSSDDNFAIATSAELVGEGYRFFSNAFGDLFVSGGGGDDFATLAGTRGFSNTSLFLPGAANGNDVYFGRDNFSRITNDLWDGRFLDFETQRVDLLSGDDRSTVQDTLRPETFYRVDGNDLVGAFRRFVNVEEINVNGAPSVDTLFRPQSGGTLLEQPDRFVFIGDFVRASDDEVSFSTLGQEIVPRSFTMRFSSFEQIIG